MEPRCPQPAARAATPNLGEGAGVEVWDAYNTWELERPVEVEEIDHLLLRGGAHSGVVAAEIYQNGYPTGSFAGGISVCF